MGSKRNHKQVSCSLVFGAPEKLEGETAGNSMVMQITRI